MDIMKYNAFIPILLLATVHPQRAWTQAMLEVEAVLSKPNAGGVVRIALCSGKDAFEKEVGCKLKVGEVRSGTVTVRFDDLPPGMYALKAFHDIDSNGNLNTNWIGIPNEPYGFGNDARRLTGPPTYEMSSFRLENGMNRHRVLLE